MQKKQAYIIVGLGFGDEGKGLATDYYCHRTHNPIVIRFNGGQQAGHTVATRTGERHTFCNFGSGTLYGIPTYWSRYCTFSPEHFMDEYMVLSKQPQFFLDAHSPVTTHYDIFFNRAVEITRGSSRIGTSGYGFGDTVERNTCPHLSFSAREMLDTKLVNDKLSCIREYYRLRIASETAFNLDDFDYQQQDENFLVYTQEIINLVNNGVVSIVSEAEVFQKNWGAYIFEGAQGIMLDVNFGRKPHVTKSNTTSRNAIEILERNCTDDLELNVVYVSRCYQTRHGVGPFDGMSTLLKLKNTEKETNGYNEFQGELRTSILNIDILNYALSCDRQFSNKAKKHLLITCLDQINSSSIPVYKGGAIYYIVHTDLPKLLASNFDTCLYSFNASSCFLNDVSCQR